MNVDEIVIDALLGMSLWGSRSARRVSLAGVGFMAIGADVALATHAAWHVPWPAGAALAAIFSGVAALGVFVLTRRWPIAASTLATLALSLSVTMPNIRSAYPAFAARSDATGTIGLACLAVSLAVMWIARRARQTGGPLGSAASDGAEELAGAAAAGLAGALCVLSCTDATNSSGVDRIGVMAAVAYIGGLGSPIAPVLGAALLALLARMALPLTHQPLIVDGAALLLVLVYLPDGVWPPIQAALLRLRRKPAGAHDGAA